MSGVRDARSGPTITGKRSASSSRLILPLRNRNKTIALGTTSSASPEYIEASALTKRRRSGVGRKLGPDDIPSLFVHFDGATSSTRVKTIGMHHGFRGISRRIDQSSTALRSSRVCASLRHEWVRESRLAISASAARFRRSVYK